MAATAQTHRDQSQEVYRPPPAKANGHATGSHNTPEVKHGRKPPPKAENRRSRFMRLGVSRMESAIYAIRLVGNLARKEVYDYSQEDVEAIKKALMAAVVESLQQFDHTRKAIAFSFRRNTNEMP